MTKLGGLINGKLYVCMGKIFVTYLGYQWILYPVETSHDLALLEIIFYLLK